MGPPPSGDPLDLVFGGTLQVIEAITLGMPFEVMKTKQIQGSIKTSSRLPTLQLVNSMREEGLGSFYKGIGAKVWESMLKGGIFMFSNQYFLDLLASQGWERAGTSAGLVAGGVAGVVQTTVMAPATFIVSAQNASAVPISTLGVVKKVGVPGLYAGAGAVAGRQATNWGLRQGLVAKVTGEYKAYRGGGQLSTPERIGCGLVGGGLSALNQPFEVLRVAQQTAKAQGKPISLNMAATNVYQTFGLRGFYLGVVPRIGLCAYQSLFMITFADMVRVEYKKMRKEKGW